MLDKKQLGNSGSQSQALARGIVSSHVTVKGKEHERDRRGDNVNDKGAKGL